MGRTLDNILIWLKLKYPNHLRAYFIDETGAIRTARVNYNNNLFNLKINNTRHTYLVDESTTLFDPRKKLPVAFYYTNNPQPITFTHTPPGDGQDTSTNFTNILQSKIVQDLFSPEGFNKLTLILILVIITMAVTVLLAAKNFGLVDLVAAP